MEGTGETEEGEEEEEEEEELCLATCVIRSVFASTLTPQGGVPT
jgi:hypothetical protein